MESGVVGDMKRHGAPINRCDIIWLLRGKMYFIDTSCYHRWSRKPIDNVNRKISKVYGNQARSCCNSICLSETNKLIWCWKASALNSSFLTNGGFWHLSIKQPDGKMIAGLILYHYLCLMPQSHHTSEPRTGCFEQKSYVHSRGPPCGAVRILSPRTVPVEF